MYSRGSYAICHHADKTSSFMNDESFEFLDIGPIVNIAANDSSVAWIFKGESGAYYAVTKPMREPVCIIDLSNLLVECFNCKPDDVEITCYAMLFRQTFTNNNQSMIIA